MRDSQCEAISKLFRETIIYGLVHTSVGFEPTAFSLSQDHKRGYMAWWNQWNQPDTVPKCITSSLQTFSWSGYYGIPQDKDIVVYILTNACQLKTLTISSDNIYTPKYEMIKELSLSYRASTTCRLIFVYIVESNSNFTIFVLSPKSRFFLMLL